MPEDGATIGDRLAALRRQVSLTQEQLAESAGVSVETIRKLERNVRTSARLGTLHALARALRIPTSALFGSAGRPGGDRVGPGPSALRRELYPALGLDGAALDSRTGDPAPDHATLTAATAAVDRAYHADDYATALAELPPLLRDARLAVEAAGDDQRPAALRLLSQAEQMAGTVLIQLRRFDLAHRALDRALGNARAAGDDLLAAATIVSTGWLLLREGRLDEAERLSVATADAIEPSFTRAPPEHLATWGWLLLRGSAAAARDNRADRALDLLDAAAAAAVRVSRRGNARSPAPGTVGSFDAATVAMKRVEAAVVAGDTARALTLADRIPRTGAATSNNVNRHRLDVAFAQLDARRYREATGNLLQLHRDAPSWLRQQRYARDIVAGLIDRRALRGADRITLAGAVGLPG